MSALKISLAAAMAATVAGHGSMITPPPRSAHGQSVHNNLQSNLCSCTEHGDCYSNITGVAQYCGVGCLGEACLYYQIGCYAGCGTCSYSGKDLYPTAEDLELANNCKPIEPTLPDEFRSYNIDDLSSKGDWTKVNPWRAPGTAGLGNPAFQPCGVNSGWLTDSPVRGSAGPPTGTEAIGANGTDLPPVGPPTVWKSGGTAEVEFSIYANHAGGYAYRLCKQDPNGKPTEECFQQGHLEFATDQTEIRYYDGSRAPFNITARTVSEGTHPTGSQWRLNPIPMCNCDQGAYCKGGSKPGPAPAPGPAGGCEAAMEADCSAAKKQGVGACDKCLKTNWDKLSAAGCDEKTAAGFCGKEEEQDTEDTALEMFHRRMQKGETCKAVPKSECGHTTGVNGCLKCAAGKKWDCEECCPGCKQESKGDYTYCECSAGPSPSPTPGPPAGKCLTAMQQDCSLAKKQGVGPCDKCLKTNWDKLSAAGCDEKTAAGFCGKSGGGGGNKPKPSSGTQFVPYSKTYLPEGVTSPSCPTGLMFNASWPEGAGSGPSPSGYGRMPYSMTDLVKVPSTLGRYTLSWRWDCEQTPQVWNSCADIVIV